MSFSLLWLAFADVSFYVKLLSVICQLWRTLEPCPEWLTFHPRLWQRYSGADLSSFAYTQHAIVLARDLVPLCFAWFWPNLCPKFHGYHKALAEKPQVLLSTCLPFIRPISSRWPCTPPLLTVHGLSPPMVQLYKSLQHATIFLFSVDVFLSPQLSFRPFHCYQPSEPYLLSASLCPQHSLQSSHYSGLFSFLPLQIKFDTCLLKPQIYPSSCLPRHKVHWVQSISPLYSWLLIDSCDVFDHWFIMSGILEMKLRRITT